MEGGKGEQEVTDNRAEKVVMLTNAPLPNGPAH